MRVKIDAATDITDPGNEDAETALNRPSNMKCATLAHLAPGDGKQGIGWRRAERGMLEHCLQLATTHRLQGLRRSPSRFPCVLGSRRWWGIRIGIGHFPKASPDP